MGKNIILCCDGTGQQFQENKSNPLRLHYCLHNDANQISFYNPGVGTFDPSRSERYDEGWLGDLTSWARSSVEGKGFGYGIVRNITDAYRFLMQTYDGSAGDRVYIFGFSRGAFTAQAVAGMLNKCGLLYAHNENLLSYATEIYLKRGNDGIAKDFKNTMARACKPYMLGVWDTVKSLGDSHQDDFFYASPAENAVFGYHAVSIDEQRADFLPSLWDAGRHDNLEQVWFAGVHSDVGGGYPHDGLGNIGLRWMIERAREHQVQFRDERVEEFQGDWNGEPNESFTGWIRIRGSEPRAVAEQSRVHQTALRRRQERSAYNPEQLPADDRLIAVPNAS